MDSNAYLQRHGWKPGSGLGGSHGIIKPILVAHKYDNLGLGKKKHNHADVWWERAFDSSLKTLDVSTNTKGNVSVTQTEKNGALNLIVTKGLDDMNGLSPLYRYFVKGAGMEGTMKSAELAEAESGEDRTLKSKKRKREDEKSGKGKHSYSRKTDEDGKSGKKRRKELRKLSTPKNDDDEASSSHRKREKSSAEKSDNEIIKRAWLKKEKKERKEKKRAAKAEKSEIKQEAKRQTSESTSSPISEDSGIEVTPELDSGGQGSSSAKPIATEDKDKRKERKERRKAGKLAKKACDGKRDDPTDKSKSRTKQLKVKQSRGKKDRKAP